MRRLKPLSECRNKVSGVLKYRRVDVNLLKEMSQLDVRGVGADEVLRNPSKFLNNLRVDAAPE